MPISTSEVGLFCMPISSRQFDLGFIPLILLFPFLLLLLFFKEPEKIFIRHKKK